ncbi:hypothetical protein V1509DRAFT_124596 [Lipomyces kononenkoae]
MSPPTFAAVFDFEESLLQRSSNSPAETGKNSAGLADGGPTSVSVPLSGKATSCVSVGTPTNRRSILVYDSHQCGHFDDIEASEAIAQRLDAFRYDERTSRTSSPRIVKSTVVPCRTSRLFQNLEGNAPTKRKMLKPNICTSMTKPLGMLSKRHSRSISARAAAAFRPDEAKASSRTDNSNAAGGAAFGKKTERRYQQRRIAITNILSPEKAVSRSKLLTLRFPVIRRHNEELLLSQSYYPAGLFDAGWRGPEGEMVAFQPIHRPATGAQDDGDGLILPCGSRNSDGGPIAGKIGILDGEADKATIQACPQFDQIVRERSSISKFCGQVSDIGACDGIVDLDDALSSHSTRHSLQCDNGRGFRVRAGTDFDMHVSIEPSNLEPPCNNNIPLFSPIEVEHNFPLGSNRGSLAESSYLPSSTGEGQQSGFRSQPRYSVSVSLDSGLIVSPTKDPRSIPHIVEIPDSEDEDEFASDVDTLSLVQTSEADLAVRNCVRRDGGVQHRDSRTVAFKQLPPLVALTSPPQSSLSKSPSRKRVLTSQSRGFSMTANRNSGTSPRTKGGREVDRKENVNLRSNGRGAQLELLSAAELRNILKRWGFKAPQSKKDMIATILHYDCKLKTATSDDDTSENGGGVMSTDAIKVATMNRISRHMHEAESARAWWMKMLTYEPIIVEDLVQYLEQEGILASSEKHNLVVVKEWCDSVGVCMISRDSPARTRRRH